MGKSTIVLRISSLSNKLAQPFICGKMRREMRSVKVFKKWPDSLRYQLKVAGTVTIVMKKNRMVFQVGAFYGFGGVPFCNDGTLPGLKNLQFLQLDGSCIVLDKLQKCRVMGKDYCLLRGNREGNQQLRGALSTKTIQTCEGIIKYNHLITDFWVLL